MSWQAIQRARQRLSREQGAIVKDWGGRLPIALVYPNTYQVGMSSLGFQTIYGLLNAQADVVCERAFWENDTAKGPVLSLESQRPLDRFAVVAFSITFELDYFHVVSVLRDASIPPLAAERDERHPLVIAGGPCVISNPEPIAPFFDALAIGEGEVLLPGFLAVLRESIAEKRDQQLRGLAAVPGMYVPSLHDVGYHPDGTVAYIRSQAATAPLPVRRQWVANLDEYATTSVVLSREAELGDMYLIEVARGCNRGCRFCLASYCFQPMRERSLQTLLHQAQVGLRYRQRIGLVGAAVSDHSQMAELAQKLRRLGAQVSVASLRLDRLPEELLSALAESGTKTITLAPETGSYRLRRFIGKAVTDQQILEAATAIARHGLKRLKLYYMVGLPGEREEDVRDIVQLTLAIKARMAVNGLSPQITVSATPFVPKAQTPFEEVPMAEAAEIEDRLSRLKADLPLQGVKVEAESAAWAAVQGVLARGDRRVAQATAQVQRPTLAAWRRALAEVGLSADFYLYRLRAREEIMPWATVDVRANPAPCAPR